MDSSGKFSSQKHASPDWKCSISNWKRSNYYWKCSISNWKCSISNWKCPFAGWKRRISNLKSPASGQKRRVPDWKSPAANQENRAAGRENQRLEHEFHELTLSNFRRTLCRMAKKAAASKGRADLPVSPDARQRVPTTKNPLARRTG
jgi:hypothetical protein